MRVPRCQGNCQEVPGPVWGDLNHPNDVVTHTQTQAHTHSNTHTNTSFMKMRKTSHNVQTLCSII